MPDNPVRFLTTLFEAAVKRADPRCADSLPVPGPASGRTVVVGAGKASVSLAQALVRSLNQQSRAIDEGFVICPYGSGALIEGITCFEAAHPVPDENSVAGARKILQLAQGLQAGDDLIVLLSGGGSSLMALPVQGVSLVDKKSVTDQLLKSGAPIQDINCVRKHLSQIKGGKLAFAAAPARVTTLAISDVVGNDPSIIASGPTVSDTSTPGEAREILMRYELDIPDTVTRALNAAHAEPPPKVLPANVLPDSHYHFIATPEDALDEAVRIAATKGLPDLKIHNLGCNLEGDAQIVAAAHAAMALDFKERGGSHLILSGGELTCQLPAGLDYAAHSGGPNHAWLLGLLLALGGTPGIFALAADTDGKDGSTDAAGAFIRPEDWHAAQELASELAPETALAGSNSGPFFSALGTSIVTGPTHTNVNDFRAILILESNPEEKC